jgi:putative PIN family toxin of toxin-antitoxin system
MISHQGPSAEVLDAWRRGKFRFVTCSAILVEVLEKLGLPRIAQKYRVTQDGVNSLVADLHSAAEWATATASVVPPPPDPDDVMLFATAIESDADYIVTGDKALLSFEWPGRTRVISPRTFVEVLRHESESN